MSNETSAGGIFSKARLSAVRPRGDAAFLRHRAGADAGSSGAGCRRLHVLEFRRSGLRRSAGRPHGARRRAHARKAPISASTSTSIARSRAAGARASGSICKARGNRACRARATSCRSRPRSFIAPASRRPMPIAARPTARPFDRLEEAQREEVLVALSSGKVTFDNGLPARAFWTTLYQTVMEGMFSDPIYGGNRNKAGWRLIGFPGVIAVQSREHREISATRSSPPTRSALPT